MPRDVLSSDSNCGSFFLLTFREETSEKEGGCCQIASPSATLRLFPGDRFASSLLWQNQKTPLSLPLLVWVRDKSGNHKSAGICQGTKSSANCESLKAEPRKKITGENSASLTLLRIIFLFIYLALHFYPFNSHLNCKLSLKAAS